jgi:hypothetical protein
VVRTEQFVSDGQRPSPEPVGDAPFDELDQPTATLIPVDVAPPEPELPDLPIELDDPEKNAERAPKRERDGLEPPPPTKRGTPAERAPSLPSLTPAPPARGPSGRFRPSTDLYDDVDEDSLTDGFGPVTAEGPVAAFADTQGPDALGRSVYEDALAAERDELRRGRVGFGPDADSGDDVDSIPPPPPPTARGPAAEPAGPEGDDESGGKKKGLWRKLFGK